MYIQLKNNLRGYVKIRVQGDSKERFLNLCQRYGLVVWGITNEEYSYQLYISVKDYRSLRPIVRKTGTRITILEKKGLPFRIFRLRKRKTFFIGMIVSVFLIYVMSLYIWNIDVTGNVTQSTHEILEYLDTIKVSHGSRKKDIVCEFIETELRKKYPNMLWVSAQIQGTNIIIKIKENIDKDIISAIEKPKAGNYSIIANESGRIREIIVRKGTALVRQGDLVEKGQVLVNGFYEIKDDAGNIVRYEGIFADADIVIQTSEPYFDEFSLNYISTQYTEKKRLGMKIHFGGNSFGWNPPIPYEHYETVIKTKRFRITKNFYFPLTIDFLWYLESVPQTKKYTKKEIISIVNTRFKQKYENKIQKGVQILEKDVKIDINGELCKVTGSVELLVPVTTNIPAEIPKVNYEVPLEGDN